MACVPDFFLGLLAILFPPLPVWVKCGICSADSIINILLLMLGYLPGLIHAWYIIAKYPDPIYEYEGPLDDGEAGQHIYVFVRDGRGGHRVQHQQPNKRTNNNMNYGTAAAQGDSSSSHAHQQPHQSNQVPHEEGVVDNGAGSSADAGGSTNAPPPSYAQVVAGDHKIQSRD